MPRSKVVSMQEYKDRGRKHTVKRDAIILLLDYLETASEEEIKRAIKDGTILTVAEREKKKAK